MHRSDELAYIAGFFDGEGCVNFTQSGQYKVWVIRVMIRNTNMDVLKYVQSLFGGRIYSTDNQERRPSFKDSHCWVATGQRAVDFLGAIDPWLRIKHEQSAVAFAWDCVRNKDKQTKWSKDKEYKACIDLLVRQLRWLNKKGPDGQRGSDPITASLQKDFGTLLPSEYIDENFEFVEEEPSHASH